MRHLTAEGLLANGASGYLLTEKGRVEALRVLRAHRLWETYLQQQIGAPAEEIHPRAHRLEHIRDVETVDYLDDLLNHPVVDPHGAEIPQDPVLLEPGQVFPLSMLRSGRDAFVEKIAPEESPRDNNGCPNPKKFPLKPGERIRVESRIDGGRTWVIVREDGERISLSHETADSILIRAD